MRCAGPGAPGEKPKREEESPTPAPLEYSPPVRGPEEVPAREPVRMCGAPRGAFEAGSVSGVLEE